MQCTAPSGMYTDWFSPTNFTSSPIVTLAADVMAIRHKTLPIQATQFHPESILSMQDNVGLSMICNVINQLVKVEA